MVKIGLDHSSQPNPHECWLVSVSQTLYSHPAAHCYVEAPTATGAAHSERVSCIDAGTQHWSRCCSLHAFPGRTIDPVDQAVHVSPSCGIPHIHSCLHQNLNVSCPTWKEESLDM